MFNNRINWGLLSLFFNAIITKTSKNNYFFGFKNEIYFFLPLKYFLF